MLRASRKIKSLPLGRDMLARICGGAYPCDAFDTAPTGSGVSSDRSECRSPNRRRMGLHLLRGMQP